MGIGDPDIAIPIHMQAMGKYHQAATKRRDDIAIGIDLDDRIEAGTGTAIAAAAIDRPQMSTVGIDVDAGGRAPLATVWQHRPAVDGAVGIGSVVDWLQLSRGGCHRHQGEECETALATKHVDFIHDLSAPV